MPNTEDAVLLHFTCPHCQASLSAPASQAGATIACSSCQAGVRVPAAPAPVVPAPEVVSRVEMAPPPQAAPAPASVPVDIATTATLSVGQTPADTQPATAEITAESMTVTSDPAAITSPPHQAEPAATVPGQDAAPPPSEPPLAERPALRQPV
ncbi:MAG: hypothetical protein NTW87_12515, partial [Planctomycetota bacterium]|nr:hypothetical protein [Planctomycetota bacterium]